MAQLLQWVQAAQRTGQSAAESLDAKTTKQSRKTLLKNGIVLGCRSRGATIFFVSHDIKAVERVSDGVLWIDEHRVREDGSVVNAVAIYKENLS